MKTQIQYLPHYSDDWPRLGYAHDGDAGFDLRAATSEPVTLYPGERRVVPAGFRIAVPPGHYARVAPRSGLAVEHGVDILAGVLDSSYRGEVGVVVINLGDKKSTSFGPGVRQTKDEIFTINPGDRIAQMIIQPIVVADLEAVDDLESTTRGVGGFGSTGTD